VVVDGSLLKSALSGVRDSLPVFGVFRAVSAL
jgi:hypothetical protein